MRRHFVLCETESAQDGMSSSGEDRVAVTPDSGCLIDALVSVAPVPRQQIIEPMNRMLGNASEDVGEPGLRINIVHLGRLCRPPNYAERVW